MPARSAASMPPDTSEIISSTYASPCEARYGLKYASVMIHIGSCVPTIHSENTQCDAMAALTLR